MIKTSPILLALFLCFWSIANGGMNLDNYHVTWDQDFTKMKTLSVTPWGPTGPGGSTWIAHTPYAGDWVNFQDPSGPYKPFNVGNGYLTIRAQSENGKLYGGLLSSMDSAGRGFSQAWGYFEMSAKLPKGPGTWPAFWLLSVPGLVNKSINSQEIDIVEQYGNANGSLFSTLHLWDKANPKDDWGQGISSRQCSMTTGFHTYGLDIQPDVLTFYYDRLEIWKTPNKIPGHPDTFNGPYYVLVNLAYGGGVNNNFDGSPQDFLVEYVRVWQGSGGSKNSNATNDSNAVSYPTAGLTLVDGEQVELKGVSLVYTSTGVLQVTSSSGTVLWKTPNAAESCNKNCRAIFQNDGNLVLSNANKPYWASNTYNNNMGSMYFQNVVPYLQIYDGNCNVKWHT